MFVWPDTRLFGMKVRQWRVRRQIETRWRVHGRIRGDDLSEQHTDSAHLWPSGGPRRMNVQDDLFLPVCFGKGNRGTSDG